MSIIRFTSGLRNCAPVANYDLSARVAFEEVPLRWRHANTSRFWVLQDLGYCVGDICWDELAFPFSHAAALAQSQPEETGGDAVSYATQWGIVLVAIGTCVLYLASDYW